MITVTLGKLIALSGLALVGLALFNGPSAYYGIGAGLLLFGLLLAYGSIVLVIWARERMSAFGTRLFIAVFCVPLGAGMAWIALTYAVPGVFGYFLTALGVATLLYGLYVPFASEKDIASIRAS